LDFGAKPATFGEGMRLYSLSAPCPSCAGVRFRARRQRIGVGVAGSRAAGRVAGRIAVGVDDLVQWHVVDGRMADVRGHSEAVD
jgi:hypothetical protein